MELAFLGGATTVTGSQFLLDTGEARVLVDCGMFQGNPNDTVRNRLPFAYEPREIDAVLLTHAHLDHCGLIPHLVASGYGGPIYATAGTAELAGLILLDAAKLQAEFAKRVARRARRQGRGQVPRDAEAELRASGPVVTTEIDEPLYDEADALAALRQFKQIRYGAEVPVAKGVTARLIDAGHILGSAIIVVGAAGRTIVFSGDLGRRGSPIVRDPTKPTDADYVVVESTYGGREHEPEAQAVAVLAETVNAVHDAGGVLLVPAFAVGRTQDMVWELDRLLAADRIPQLPLYLDSPMASKATDIYRRHPEYFDEEMRALLASRDDPLDYPGAIVTNDVAKSRAIKEAPRPYMIVASNGMLTGGRVLNHLRTLIDDPNATILFVGYQGEGTMGAHLQRGVKQVVIDGTLREVRCGVRSIDGFSAHADEPQLLDWIGAFGTGKREGDPGFPKTVFIVHGDPLAELAIRPKIERLGFRAKIPSWRERVTLDEVAP
ncbi:MAG TPA: MBL fold metallo-hydrolase [Candidatus Limnocylindria bacterium]|jgi:metallo-beta-lactamase family protein|nr:MBL fold metallo-hydrolase [Candidatus Limnocylindria bacterium]